jgi:hypothetical protein
VELEIDFAIAGRYGDYHERYARNLAVFNRFIRVFELFFKKQKYENSRVAVDGDARNRAVIRFCSRDFRLSLRLDPLELDRAIITLESMGEEGSRELAHADIVKSENVVFPGGKPLSLKDDYEVNNAVLDFFITAVGQAQTAGARRSPARK